MIRRPRPIFDVLRLALSALIILSAVSIAPRVASAAEESYTSDVFGFSVSWDNSTWRESDADGAITLETDASTVMVTGFDDATNDMNGCVSRLGTKRKRTDGVSDFKRVTSAVPTVDAPEGAVSALYSFSDNGAPKLLYIECRNGDADQLVRISFETDSETYESEVAAFDAVYQTIEIGGGAASNTGNSSSSGGSNSGPGGRLGNATKTPTPEAPEPTATKTPSNKTTKSDPVLKGNLYTGANKAFTVTFDDAIWNDVSAIEPDGSGYEGLNLTSDTTVGSFEVFAGSTTLDGCISASITGMKQADGFSEVAENPDLEKPVTAKGAVGVMVDFVLATDNGPVNLTRYLECRTLVKGKSLIRVELAAASSRIDEVLPAWTDLLAGIKIAKTSTTSTTGATPTPKAKATKTPTAKKTPKATSTPEGAAFPNVDGNTFTSPAFGFTFTWPADFTPLLASGSDTGDVIAVSDGSTSVLIFTKSTSDGTTFSSCLSEKEDALKTSDTSTDVAVLTSSSGEEVRGETSTGAFVAYTYTSDKGVEIVDYLRCDIDPAGTFVIDFTFLAPSSTFDADLLSTVLDGIKLSDSGSL